MSKCLISLKAEVGGSSGGSTLKPLKTRRRHGGAEVPHTPYALPLARRSRSASGLRCPKPELPAAAARVGGGAL
jgi:hypothetical protein